MTIIVLLSVSAWHPVFGISFLSHDLDVSCLQMQMRIICDYRQLTAESPEKITAYFNGNPLPVEKELEESGAQNNVIVLFLVDTSDPNRQAAIDSSKKHISQIIQAGRMDYKFGLAHFDKGLQILSPVGSDVVQISQAVHKLEAKGLVTELYRSLLQAMDELDSMPARRKIIFLLSDGLAEDHSYFHKDAVIMARRSRIVINSIGYPRSKQQLIALQSLRRLSEETGGYFVEANHSYQLPQGFAQDAYMGVHGGIIRVELAEMDIVNVAEPHALQIDFHMQSGTKRFTMPVEMPAALPDLSLNVPNIQPPSIPEQNDFEFWLRYAAPVVLLLLLMLVLLVFMLLRRREQKEIAKQQEISSKDTGVKPLAYLLSEHEDNKRYPITRITWRIGRGQENDMVVDDLSVSRRHAEIQRLYNGKFIIRDAESANGVYVNKVAVRNKCKLSEGDLIEIGEAIFNFTERSAEYAIEDKTIMLKTSAPDFD